MDPAGNPQPGVLVRISISTADGSPAIGPGGNSIIIPVSTSADALGNWSLSLIPQSQITPSGSEYSVTEGHTTAYFIVVPDGAGPTAVNSIRTAPPMTPTDGQLMATNVRVTSGTGLAATNVQTALAELKTDIGTGGAGVEITSHKGVASGYASLDGTTHVPVAQLPVIPASDISVAGGAGVTATQVQAAILELHNAIGTGGAGVEVTSHKDAANGYPSLDNTGKILVSELPVIPASDISVAPITGVTATTVQTAVQELYGDIQSISAGSTGAPGVGVPVGGALHQILRKKTTADYDTEWANETGLPVGGTSNQVLAKRSATDFDYQWQTDTATTAGVSVYPFFVIAPGDSWSAALAAHPTKTTFIIKAGVHQNVTLFLASGTNDNLRFIGEPGAIVDGGMIKRTVTGVSTVSGSGVLTAGSSVFTSVDVSGSTPTTVWGGPGYSQNIGAVSTAQSGTTITLDDTALATVSAQTITLTRPPAAGIDRFLDGDAHDIWIKNIEIRNYAVIRNRAAIHPQFGDDITRIGMKWVIEDCLIHDNANEGGRICDGARYRRCKVYNNGDIGLAGTGMGAEIDDCEVYGNDTFSNNAGFDASGMKFTVTMSLSVHDCRVHDNFNNGIWLDVDCFNSRVENNIVWNNTGCGIMVETSYRTIIRGNQCWSNGPASPTGSFYTGCANILVSASSEVEVCYNKIGKVGTSNLFNGIGVLFQDRAKFTLSRTVSDMHFTNGSATVTSTLAAFRTDDEGAYINTSGLTDFTTFLHWNPTLNVWQIVGDGGAPKIWAASTVTQSANILAGTDNWGNTTQGQSNMRQRCYNISIHNNSIKCENTGSGVLAGGMNSDTMATGQLGVFRQFNIRWFSNYYDFDPTVNFFAFNNVFYNIAGWHGLGMDTQILVPTATPNTGGNWLAPMEGIMPPGDVMGIQNAMNSNAAAPWLPWISSEPYTANFASVRPSSPNGFLYQCTTSGTTAATPPTWPTTVGGTVTDGTVVWRCLGVDPMAISGTAVIDLSLGRHLTYYLMGNVTSWSITSTPSSSADYEITFVNGFVPYTLGGAIGLNVTHIDDISPRAPTALHRKTISYHWDGAVLRQKTASVTTPNSVKGPFIAAAMTATDTTSMATCTANGFNWQCINTNWGTLQPSLGATIDPTAGGTLLTQIQNGLQAGGASGGLLPWVDLGTSKAATWLTTNVEQFLDECGNTWNPASLHSQNVANWVWSQKGQVYLLDWINKLFAFLGQNTVTYGGVTVPAITTLAGVGVGGVLNNELHYPQGNDAGAGTATVSSFSAGTITFTGTVPATFGTSGLGRNNGTATGVVFSYTGRSAATLTGVVVLTSDATITAGQVIAPMSFWGYGLNMQTGVNAGLTDTIANGTAGTSVQTVCPLPGYVPFVGPTQTNAKDIQWMNWYLGGLQVFEAWLLKAVRAAIVANGGTCPIWVKHPNTGIRTSLPTMPSVAATLTSYLAAAAEGVDHDRMIATYSQANNPQGALYGPIYPDATGANLNGQDSWIGGIADTYGVKSRIMGEDAGAIDWTAQWGFPSTGNTGPLSRGFWATFAAISTGVGSGNFTTLAALIAAN